MVAKKEEKEEKEGEVIEKKVVTTTTRVKKGSPKKKKTTTTTTTKKSTPQKKTTTKRKSPAKKKTTTRKKSTSTRAKTITKEVVPPILIENFVSLQRVLAELSGKINALTNQTSKLLDLFEQSAKTLMEKDLNLTGDNKDVVDRLNKLLDQNKVLAQGIALLHEPREEEHQEPEEQDISPIQPTVMPQNKQQRPPTGNTNNYQRSISSKY